MHKDDGYKIHFAKRGSSDRTGALKNALEITRSKFNQKWGINSNAAISIFPVASSHCPELQATDYFLWALQRYYERHEEKYIEFLWSKIGVVHDLDDCRQRGYGMYYSQKNPLIQKIKPGI